MNALVAMALAEDEVELMTFVLGHTRDGRNRLHVARLSPDAPMIRDLEQRGMMAVRRDGWGTMIASVTVAGARELVRRGVVAMADLAADVDRVLGSLQGLIRYREDLRQRWGDAVAADLSVWNLVQDEPYARVAAAVLMKRGLVEQRGPEGDLEFRSLGADAVLIRAREAGR